MFFSQWHVSRSNFLYDLYMQSYEYQVQQVSSPTILAYQSVQFIPRTLKPIVNSARNLSAFWLHPSRCSHSQILLQPLLHSTQRGTWFRIQSKERKKTRKRRCAGVNDGDMWRNSFQLLPSAMSQLYVLPFPLKFRTSTKNTTPSKWNYWMKARNSLKKWRKQLATRARTRLKSLHGPYTIDEESG